MKAAKLIDALRTMPPDAEVFHLWDGEARTVIEHVWLARDGNVLTADNSMVCYSTETRPVDAPTSDENRYWQTPGAPEEPKSALDRLAEQFSAAAREEVRRDTVTGRPYRANLAVTTWQGSEQFTLWTDMDEAPRPIAQKSFVQRREQMVGDAVQLSFDVEHWNRVHAGEEPIVMPMDFTDDVAVVAARIQTETLPIIPSA